MQHIGSDKTAPERRCIVTGLSGPADALIRFVADPDGMLVPDLRRTLPGRGCWVTANGQMIGRAVEKNLFARALRQRVTLPDDLAGMVDALMVQRAAGALAMARKAGLLVDGAAKVDKAIRSGRAIALIHASEAAADGVRKLDQARRATVHLGGPDVPTFTLLTQQQLGLAFGSGNAIHAAVLDGRAGLAALQRLEALRDYRMGSEGLPVPPQRGGGEPNRNGVMPQNGM